VLIGKLENQVAIVFGGTGRVGSAIAETLSARGAKVIIHYHRRSELARSLVAQITEAGGIAEALQADVTDEEAVQKLGQKVISHFGAIHIVVNTVHRDFEPKLLTEMNWTDWDVHIEALKGHFFICKSVLLYMRKQKYGRIVYISGGLSHRVFKGCSAYTTIKAGLNGFCKTIALEEGEHNITANIVAPGKVIPKGGGESNENPDAWDELDRESLSKTPLKRFATADDVAHAVLYFVSPEASGITGQTLFVAGGEIMP
jgi:3-oxoacyl-[acyl-carrier protein] reductase